MLVAKIGVQYVAPYLSQMNLHDIDAHTEISLLRSMKEQYGFQTKLMIASIQSISDVTHAANIGVSAATLSPSCLKEWLSGHELTQKITDIFAEHFSSFAQNHGCDLFATLA
ncbi:transaldolase family protein [Candidatus Berkiella aquae]|uniref:Putative transaldolase n=1 Tax=Candidatus Berkiella aquae TaxID=295108 RepID=A0A0Q9YXE0_9GAMM|nr:transaldolase family protein [Candidatus Berkiella aquae]MCS5711279.1 hypothetical protein [Candidatus Berkiella aquae]